MSQPIRVEIDGHPPLEFEAGTSQEVIDRVVQETVKSGKPAGEEPNWLQRRGRDVFSGAADMIDVVPAAMEFISGGKLKNLRRFGKEAQEALGIERNKPTGQPLEDIQQNIGQFLGGALLGPGGTPMKAGMSVGAGALGYVGEKMGGPAGKFLGELIGAGPGAYLAARTPNTVKAFGDIIRGEGEEGVRTAAANAARAAEQGGIPVSVAQGIPFAGSQLEKLGELLAKGSPEAQRILREQQTSGIRSLDEMVGELSKLPRTQETSNRVADSGARAVAQPARARTAATAPYYEQLNNLRADPQLLRSIVDRLRAARADRGTAVESAEGEVFTELMRQYDAMARRADNSFVSAAEANNPGAFLGRLAHEANTNAMSDATDKALTGARISAATTAKDAIEQAIPEVGVANRAFQRHSGPVERMEASRMPEHFLPRNGGPGDMLKMTKILDTTPDQIQYAANRFRYMGDPQAFSTLVREHWSLKLDDAMKSKTGQVPKDAMGKVYSTVAGTPTQRTNSLAAIRANAEINGLNPDEAVRNAEEVIDLLGTYSRMRGGGALDAKQIKQDAAANAASAGLRTPGFLVGASPMAASIDRIVSNRVMENFSNLMFRPGEIDQLLEFIRTVPWERRRNALETYLMGMAGGNAGER